MLTDQQLTNLKPLCDHPRYGFIVQKAIEVWSGEINPEQFNWGVDVFNNKWDLTGNHCCLLSPSLIGKNTKNSSSILNELSSYFSTIEYSEIFAIVWGFDNCDPESQSFNENCKNAYEFGKSVSKAIWE